MAGAGLRLVGRAGRRCISVAGRSGGAYDHGLGVFALSTPRAVDSMPVPSGTSSLLLGREQDIAELGEALGLAAQGSPQVVLVGGEAGIGKTTLVADLERRASGWGSPWRLDMVSTSRPASRSPRRLRRCGPCSPGSMTWRRGRRHVACSPCWTRTHRGVGRRSMCWTTSPRSSSKRRPPARCW